MGNDVKLLGYVAAALFFFMGIMLLLRLPQAGRVRGATMWLWSTLTVAVGIVLNTSQEIIPQFFGLVVSNALRRPVLLFGWSGGSSALADRHGAGAH